MRTKKNRRWVLLNPGPVNVSSRVRKALLGPDLCHREEEFSRLLARVRLNLLRIFRIRQTHTVAIFTGSGTSALEAMLGSLSGPVLVLSNGVYGDRIKQTLETQGTRVIALSCEPGSFPAPERVERILSSNSRIQAITMVHHETSTGMLNPIEKIGALAKKYKKIFAVDAISSLGGETLDFKKTGIGLLCGTSGKCLHGFPGISFVFVSKKVLRRIRGVKPKSLYLDLLHTLDHEEREDTPFTPAVQILFAFDEALKELIDEGLEHRIGNYRKRNQILEQGLSEIGVRFLVVKEHRSHVLTALWTPQGIRYEDLHNRLKKKGFVIYAGQSQLKGKIFRVANLGDLNKRDFIRFLSELAKILRG